MTWTQRILEFPVRARGTGDLNAVLTTLNESGLCREAVRHWTRNGWIVIAPNTPLLALTGPAFDRAMTLSDFCGEVEVLGEPLESHGFDEMGEEGGPQHADS
jgi:hypothetical protein